MSLPLDLFGIELQQVVEIIARAPDRVNAFISALLEIARNYSLRDENFFFAALRAYQELRTNYFEEIEVAADTFVQQFGLPANGGVPPNLLAKLLEKQFGYRIDEQGLDPHPELQNLRSLYQPAQKAIAAQWPTERTAAHFPVGQRVGFQCVGIKRTPANVQFFCALILLSKR